MVRRGHQNEDVGQPCPNQEHGCQVKIKDQEFERKHLQICLYSIVDCEGCHKTLFLKDLTRHQKVTHCLENKLKYETALTRKKLSEQVRSHQLTLRQDRVKLEKNLTRGFRERIHSRYGYTPRVPQAPKPGSTPRGTQTTQTEVLQVGKNKEKLRVAAVFQDKEYDVSARLESLTVIKSDELSEEMSAVNESLHTDPCPSRLIANEPQVCARCNKVYWENKVHTTPCFWHAGPMIQLFGGTCTTCGRMDFQKGCLSGNHIVE